MLLTFIAAAHPSLTHFLFALCFIERHESVFPFYCPAQPILLPRWYVLQTAAGLIKRSMWPNGGTKNSTVTVLIFHLTDFGWWTSLTECVGGGSVIMLVFTGDKYQLCFRMWLTFSQSVALQSTVAHSEPQLLNTWLSHHVKNHHVFGKIRRVSKWRGHGLFEV